MCPSNPDAKLNSTSAGIVAIKGSKNVSAQLMLFYTIYTDYDRKLLAGVGRSAILWDKFKGLASRGGPKVSQKEREGEDEVLVHICFGTQRLVLILIMILRICL